MDKDFKTWNKSKQAIHLFKKRAMLKEREIFYAKLGSNKRLMNKIGKIRHEKFIELKKQLSVILQL